MLEGPVSGLEKDRNWTGKKDWNWTGKKTGTGLEKRPDCSLGLSYLKIKDWKKTGLWYLLITLSKTAKDHAN